MKNSRFAVLRSLLQRGFASRGTPATSNNRVESYTSNGELGNTAPTMGSHLGNRLLGLEASDGLLRQNLVGRTVDISQLVDSEELPEDDCSRPQASVVRGDVDRA